MDVMGLFAEQIDPFCPAKQDGVVSTLALRLKCIDRKQEKMGTHLMPKRTPAILNVFWLSNEFFGFMNESRRTVLNALIKSSLRSA